MPTLYQLLPSLTDDEYTQLKDDIAKHGILVPIEEDDDGNVLDGHHRLRAYHELRAAGVTVPAYPTYTRHFTTDDDRIEHALKLNLHRRHLNREQLRELAVELRGRGWTYERIGSALGIDPKTAWNWCPTALEISKAEGKDGKFYPTTYKPRQHVVLTLGEGELTERQARQQAARQRQHAPVSPSAFPPDTYRCIVIDPPWPVQKIERDERPDQGIVLDYPTMTLDDIEALPINTLAAEDGCHLYLWVTQKHLPAGLRIMDIWGFRYQCVLTWVKPTGMTPYSWMYNTEHVLFGRNGSLDLTRLGLKLSFEAPVTRHSAKPDIFYERVVAASPGPRLDLFARRQRDGFVVWGNEVEQGG